MTEAFSSHAFREALAHFASGVTIVTGRTAEGPVGFTATAFSSVSLTPPLVLVCIGRTASAHDAVVASDMFGISVLEQQQAWIAEQFAKRGVDRFQGVALRAGARVPLVDGALVQLECRQHARYDAGDHTILIGEVLGSAVVTGRPLLHFARRFGAFVEEAAPAVKREA